MKILYIGEDNAGGGAKSNLNLAASASEYADVAFFGCDLTYPSNESFKVVKSKARKAITFLYILDLWRTINNFSPDIVHATGMYTGLVAMVIRSLQLAKYKIVMTLHHTSKKFRYHILAKRLLPVLNKIDFVHYLSEYQRKIYQKFGLAPGKYKIIPNIIEVNSWDFAEVETLRQKLISKTTADCLVVSVGRLVESKQIDLFIETISNINQCGYNIGGIIVGNGDAFYLNKLKRLCKELMIESKILFEGFILRPEIYIRACDFCLFPTAHDEALPLFILESFSQKRTLVVSNHPSIRDIVRNQIDCLVVEEHTPDAYARSCIKLIDDHDLLHMLENGAETSFNGPYNPESVKQAFKNLYLEILQYGN